MFGDVVLAIALLSGLPQVHPCDEVLPVNPLLASPVTAGFCHTSQPQSTRLYIDNVLIWTGIATQITTTPNAEGLFYFETPNRTVNPGLHNAQIDVTGGAAPLSDPYVFTILPPGQAKKVRVKGGGQ